MAKRKIIRKAIWLVLAGFIFMNIIAGFHAYKFTHFSASATTKTAKPEQLSIAEKVKTLFLGVNNPRPSNIDKPAGEFETVYIQSNKKLECWNLPTTKDSVLGTVIICHGYAADKSSMLDKTEVFNQLGYNSFLIDFMGSGGSEGNTTTIGYKEAEQVKSAFEYLQKKGEKNIYLFGTSMGAVAIMKAINDYKLQPSGIIIECPFGSMYETVCARFKNMNAPTFPMAGLLVFWGGTLNGFWAFGHNPTAYAKEISCPTLLLYGEQDKNVSRKETDEIYRNLNGLKTLKTYPLAGHENYLVKYKDEWTGDVKRFLNTRVIK